MGSIGVGGERRFFAARLVVFSVAALFCAAALDAQAGQDAAALYEKGRAAAADEDWYAAAESLLECLRRSPSHAGATFLLAESYYELGEYDQALGWARKARSLARRSGEAANLEASILIALGRLDEAEAVVKETLAREPYNKEALFTASELDIARGRTSEAVTRYKNAVRLYGDDRRLLVSLALVLGSLGDYTAAASYIERAQNEHPGDYRVFYYAAYLAARAGKLPQAIRDAERCLELRPGHRAARDLLAGLRYRSEDYAEAVRGADQAIRDDRRNIQAWFLKGMSLWRLGRLAEARSVFEQALLIEENDEFVRAASEELLISDTPVESPPRRRAAEYHFKRAADYRRRNFSAEALFEYRRGLRVNPYAEERRDYAEILRQRGFPSLALEELNFMVDLGKGSQAINDSIETYTNLLSTTLSRQWPVETAELEPHWNIALFSVAAQSGFYHTDAGFIAASYLKDLMSHSRAINIMNLPLRSPSFASAFRTAREALEDGKRCDYFLLTSISEDERALSFKAELYVARTGAKAAEWTVYRAGLDRLRGTAIAVSSSLEAALPLRAVLLRRNAGRGLIDRGKIDGITENTAFDIIKKGKLEVKSEGIGFSYQNQDLAGTFTTGVIDEETAAGELARQGYFDVISPGDELIIRGQPETTAPNDAKKPPPPAGDPELRALLGATRRF